VGEGVLAKGTFQVPGRAIVNGTLEGELVAKDIVIGPTGRGVGKFTAETGDIRGEIHETFITTKSLVIRATGRITGNVLYREIEIEKGGNVQGGLSQDLPASGRPASATPASEPKQGSTAAPAK
jgi:cytoskeletal protein CcmA (bactofilin family)